MQSLNVQATEINNTLLFFKVASKVHILEACEKIWNAYLCYFNSCMSGHVSTDI